MEPDSDDELVQEIQSVLEATEPHAKNSAAASSSLSSSSSSSDSSSSSSGEDVEGSGPGPQGHATAPETAPTVAVGEGGRVPAAGSSSRRPTSTESSGYHISTSDLVEVAAALGMPEVKLIGGNIVGSLRFSSNDRERGFLAEAGSSFGFPLMEKCLMSTGVSQILQDVEDLSQKAFVASRYASRQLRTENERTSQLTRMEERVVAL